MTLDEAIEYEKESLQHCKKMLEEIYEDNFENKILKFEVKQHEHLAEWLEDYKHIKQWKSDVVEEFCRYDVSSFEELVTNTRNKAIDDFAKWLENKKYLMKEIQDHDFCYTRYDELKANYVTTEYFAEQLKGGE